MTCRHGRLSMLACLGALAASPPAAARDGDFIVTARPTRPALQSAWPLPGGALVYSDAYGVYLVNGGRTETLLTNPVQETYCLARMFGWYCVAWIPAVYHSKPMAAGPSGAIYIADPERRVIQRFDAASGAWATVAENTGTPTSLALDGEGNLYFNDPEGCRVRRLSGGGVTTVAGTGRCGYSNDGGPATEAEILSVRAIALDADGQVFIADDKAGVVRRVDRQGTILTVVGTGYPGQGGEATPARETPLHGPAALTLDREGNLFIAEAAANRVRVVGADGLVRTIAGTGAAGHAGDYGPAVSAELTAPGCLAAAESGAVWVCDSDRIRKLIPPAPGRWLLPVLGGPLARSSPGSWLTLLGDFAGLPTADWSGAIGADGALPVSLAGVSAAIGGEACVVAYVSPDRIDVLLPAHVSQGSQTLKLMLPGGGADFPVLILPAAPEFLMRASGGKLHPAAQVLPGGEEIALYATGLGVSGPITPPYDVTQPGGMQVVLGSYGYPVAAVRPFSPGVCELRFRIPAGLPETELPVRLVAGGVLSTMPVVLRCVGGGGTPRRRADPPPRDSAYTGNSPWRRNTPLPPDRCRE